MRLCPCGFANPDDAMRCAACGGALANDGNTALEDPSSAELYAPAQDGTRSVGGGTRPLSAQNAAETAGAQLLLEDVRTGHVVRIPSPGGILGRAGDFAPDLFSPRVSGVHAVVALNDEGRWTIEHTGRNASAVERGGIWSDLRCGAPQPLFGGETLKLADMVFRVGVSADERVTEPNAQVNPAGGDLGRPSPTGIVDGLTQNNAAAGTEGGPVSAPTEPTAETAWSVRCPVCGTEYAVEGPEDHIASCTFCKDPLDARQIARVLARAVPSR